MFTTAASREGMLTLARAGLVHIVASDSHSAAVGRPVAISQALEVLGTVAPMADHLEWVASTAPAAIVRGADLRPPCTRLLPSRRRRSALRHLRARTHDDAVGELLHRLRSPATTQTETEEVARTGGRAQDKRRDGIPRAQAAAIAPIIESPHPSRRPVKRGGTISNGSSSPGSTRIGSPARVTATARAPASRPAPARPPPRPIHRAPHVLGQLPIVELDQIGPGQRPLQPGARQVHDQRDAGAHVGGDRFVGLVGQALGRIRVATTST